MSQTRVVILCTFFPLLAASAIRGEGKQSPRPANPAEISRLIRQLGSNEFDEREAAGKALAAIGRPALDALLKAVAEGDDAEIHKRASALVKFVVPRYPELHCLRGHTEGINGVAFSPDGKQALSAAHDCTIRVWDLQSGKELHCLKPERDGVACTVAFSPDGKRALSGGADQMVRLWDARTWKELRHFAGHGYCVHQVAFSPDGRRAVTGGGDGKVIVWDLEKGEEIRQLRHNDAVINCVAFTADGKKVVAGCFYGIRVWDVVTGEEVQHLNQKQDGFFAVAFSPTKHYALAAMGRSLRLWDAESGKVLQTFGDQSKGERSVDNLLKADRVALSPDGNWALSGCSDNTIRLWDVRTGKELDCLNGHTHGASWLVFRSDGRQALSAGQDKTVRLWQLSGQKIPAKAGSDSEDPAARQRD